MQWGLKKTDLVNKMDFSSLLTCSVCLRKFGQQNRSAHQLDCESMPLSDLFKDSTWANGVYYCLIGRSAQLLPQMSQEDGHGRAHLFVQLVSWPLRQAQGQSLHHMSSVQPRDLLQSYNRYQEVSASWSAAWSGKERDQTRIQQLHQPHLVAYLIT